MPLAVDVSNWLRPDAPTSDERLFCHVYGHGRSADQLIPGRPYSFVAALERGRTSWCALLDALRLGPADDADPRSTAGRFAERWNLRVGEVTRFSNGYCSELVDPDDKGATEVQRQTSRPVRRVQATRGRVA